MSLSYKLENVTHGEMYYNILNWPYTYQLIYKDTSVIVSAKSKAEALKYAKTEDERRQELVMKKLKGD